jgi:hypothetical protein
MLGFDLKLRPDKYVSSQWPSERRRTYLIDPSVLWPLSVDNSVWPSVFRYNKDASIDESERRVLVEPTDFHQDALDLWAVPSDMFQAVERSERHAASDLVPIAVEILSDQPLTNFEYWRALLDDSYEVTPLSSDWACIGYDVADSSRLSGLINCSYTDKEKQEITHDWAGVLNEFGLLRTPEKALKFVSLTDRRVREHAPFFAYCIYSTQTLAMPGTVGHSFASK